MKVYANNMYMYSICPANTIKYHSMLHLAELQSTFCRNTVPYFLGDYPQVICWFWHKTWAVQVIWQTAAVWVICWFFYNHFFCTTLLRKALCSRLLFLSLIVKALCFWRLTDKRSKCFNSPIQFRSSYTSLTQLQHKGRIYCS